MLKNDLKMNTHSRGVRGGDEDDLRDDAPREHFIQPKAQLTNSYVTITFTFMIERLLFFHSLEIILDLGSISLVNCSYRQ